MRQYTRKRAMPEARVSREKQRYDLLLVMRAIAHRYSESTAPLQALDVPEPACVQRDRWKCALPENASGSVPTVHRLNVAYIKYRQCRRFFNFEISSTEPLFFLDICADCLCQCK